MSVLLFHTMTAPHVQQAARALHEAQLLERFVTGLREDPDAWWQRAACASAQWVGFDLATQLRRRAITEIPLSRVDALPWGELLRLLVGRNDPGGRISDLVWERTEAAFDRAVARRLSSRLRAVYGYEYSSRATFARAHELGLKVIYETPAPEPRFVQNILDREVAKFPELQTPFYHHTAAREERRIVHRRQEWDAADLVVANSHFTRNSFAQAGRDVRKVRVIPLGSPLPVARDQARAGGTSSGEPLRFLWAGTFGIRKGAHYLLEAWQAAKLGRHARLDVFGSQGLPARLVAPAPEGITFHRPVSRPTLMHHYQGADMLLFPTLCDGFGMVATEAWSQGLPVLTTPSAGAADLLRTGENGLLVPAADSSALAGTLQWCLDHREELKRMREPAHATAAGWQWADYRRALVAAIAPLLNASEQDQIAPS